MAHKTSPRLVLIFILFLFVPQAVQFSRQFVNGYMPFLREPNPTFFSWDMFANRVERCVLEWNPPLDFPNHPQTTSLLQLAPKLEWGITYNHVADYEWARGWLCWRSQKKARVGLNCFLPIGIEIKNELDCSKI
jgi:hypothetical protein